MENKRVKTINLQGKEYAQVKDRIKEFRTQCPNGLIATEPKIEGNLIIFKARVVKDSGVIGSPEATGHSMGENKGQKAFEKLETIAVGRALALLGYAQDGEVASSEEMEEFYAHKEELLNEQIANDRVRLESVSTLEELKTVWSSLQVESKTELGSLKNEIKKKYEGAKV